MVGEVITHFRTHFSGWIESDLHSGEWVLTHGRMETGDQRCQEEADKAIRKEGAVLVFLAAGPVRAVGSLTSLLPGGALFSFCVRVPDQTVNQQKQDALFSHGHWASETPCKGFKVLRTDFVHPQYDWLVDPFQQCRQPGFLLRDPKAEESCQLTNCCNFPL